MKKLLSLFGPLFPAIISFSQANLSSDLLYKGFRTPPNSARPRVWWHWMNGNITKDGIRKDLEWMHRVGMGGFQNFDAGLNTPPDRQKTFDLTNLLPSDSAKGYAWIQYEFAQPQTIKSISVVGGGSRSPFGLTGQTEDRSLEVSDDGINFRRIS